MSTADSLKGKSLQRHYSQELSYNLKLHNILKTLFRQSHYFFFLAKLFFQIFSLDCPLYTNFFLCMSRVEKKLSTQMTAISRQPACVLCIDLYLIAFGQARQSIET
jgi:hypothetical protein